MGGEPNVGPRRRYVGRVEVNLADFDLGGTRDGGRGGGGRRCRRGEDGAGKGLPGVVDHDCHVARRHLDARLYVGLAVVVGEEGEGAVVLERARDELAVAVDLHEGTDAVVGLEENTTEKFAKYRTLVHTLPSQTTSHQNGNSNSNLKFLVATNEDLLKQKFFMYKPEIVFVCLFTMHI